MLKFTIFICFLFGTVVNAKVSREDIAAAHQQLITAIQLDNKCVTSSDCAAEPTGARACGGPNGYAVYSTRSSNAQNILLLAQRTRELEKQYNMENSVMSICSMVMPPITVCDQTQKCVARSSIFPSGPLSAS